MLDLKHTIFLLLLLNALLAAGYDNTVYFIRHGEKPKHGRIGLTPRGEERAKCLRKVFSRRSEYNIGYIMAQHYKRDGRRERPYLTVKPLAKALGLKVDTSCGRDDEQCVINAIEAYASTPGSRNILICWEHQAMSIILSMLGIENPPRYPPGSFNYIWTIQDSKMISNTTSEDCPGLDD